MRDESEAPVQPRKQSRHFRFLALLGQGGFGEVYLTEAIGETGFRKQVAVKVLKAEWANDPEIRGRLRDEAAVLGLLRHPNIVSAEDLVELRGQPALVMEYVPGCNLTDVLKAAAKTGPLPPKVIGEVGAAVASALDAAYWRPVTGTNRPIAVLHRDIKPGNIRLTPHGEVKLLDFGIARSEVLDRSVETVDQQPGSLSYMAPELLTGAKATPESDIYSLGVVLIESILRSRFGWAGASEEEHASKVDLALSRVQDLPASFEEVLRASLAFDPTARPHASVLKQACRDLASTSSGPGLMEWAEDAVSPHAKATDDPDTGGLVGCTFEEDRTGVVSTLVPVSSAKTVALSSPPRAPGGVQTAPLTAPPRPHRPSVRSARLHPEPSEPERPSRIIPVGLGLIAGVAIAAFAGFRPAAEPQVPETTPPAIRTPTPPPAAVSDAPTLEEAVEAARAADPSDEGASVDPDVETIEDPSPGADANGLAGDPERPALIPIRSSIPEDTVVPRTDAADPPPEPATDSGPVLVGLASRPDGLAVRVDGKDVSVPTPVGLQLDPGTHTVQFGDASPVRIEVGPGQPSTWTWDAASGRLLQR